ncbi:hypothetical protein [Acetivibrio mesophilus]|jgi:pimeloyl-ACP methyl ester carboxylesterase|uniref:Hydrolase n=1 Tax=Acetivibrio straminisolvens JCM 21531 TaxID=1294263 RepID=W4V700_9FIRM|nr:hypothetical protein [Acetivibrio mesophilus]GAE88514.1 hydrolase [Acetivibrio straminisolvens JCM 21531]
MFYDIDLRKDYFKLDVPVYFFLGRHDVNAPTVLAEEYEWILDEPISRLCSLNILLTAYGLMNRIDFWRKSWHAF